MIIQNGLVFTEDCTFVTADVYTDGTKIADQANGNINNNIDDITIDATDCYVIPGLTDVHFHGCVGYDFCDGTQEAILAMARYEASQGVTTICPATMTLAEDVLAGICQTAADYVTKQNNDSAPTDCASLVGINMEGPFLSLAKKGAQNAAFLHQPDFSFYKRLQQASGNLIKLVAIAPELDGAIPFIEAAKDETVLSIAHTAADYDTAKQALNAGASHVTHLYNAMHPLTHRAPGVVGAAFDQQDCEVELVCDGVHIAPAMIRATFAMFGDDRIILISDSMMATGMEDGQYALGGQEVTVKGNTATLADGTIAGSVTNLMNCLRHVVSVGIPLESAVKCATMNPAKSIGIYNQYGSITSGKTANLVILNKDLTLKSVILNGKVI